MERKFCWRERGRGDGGRGGEEERTMRLSFFDCYKGKFFFLFFENVFLKKIRSCEMNDRFSEYRSNPPERKFADGTPPLQYDSNTTPIRLQYDSNTTPIRLQYYSNTTPILLQYYSNTTPLRLHYHSTVTPLSLLVFLPFLDFSFFVSSLVRNLFFRRKKGEECRYIYKKRYICILIAHTAERGNF